MAVVELEARLTSASRAQVQAGLRMGLEATIRRPKPSNDFGRPVAPPEAPNASEGQPGAKEG